MFFDTSTPERVIRRLIAGQTVHQVCAELGLSKKRVHSIVKDARRRQLNGSKKRAQRTGEESAYNLMAYRLKGTTRKIGSMREVFDFLTPEQIRWLAEVVPDNGSVAEYLAALARDAFFEEEAKHLEKFIPALPPRSTRAEKCYK